MTMGANEILAGDPMDFVHLCKILPRKEITLWFKVWERRLDCLWSSPRPLEPRPTFFFNPPCCDIEPMTWSWHLLVAGWLYGQYHMVCMTVLLLRKYSDILGWNDLSSFKRDSFSTLLGVFGYIVLALYFSRLISILLVMWSVACWQPLLAMTFSWYQF